MDETRLHLKDHDIQSMIYTCRKFIGDHLDTFPAKAAIIGISGGIDSALVAALAYPVCSKRNIPIYGYSLPIETNKEDEISRATNVGEEFCDHFQTYDRLKEAFWALSDNIIPGPITGELDHDTKVALGNIKARVRMTYLYGKAGLKKGFVFSTDNYTEYLLGFWTLHGDVGDLGPIRGAFKTECYAMAKMLVKQLSISVAGKRAAKAIQDCIDAVPTDGLGITVSDYDQLGCESYDEVDTCLSKMLATGTLDEKHPVYQRHINSAHKRSNPNDLTRVTLMNRMVYPVVKSE